MALLPLESNPEVMTKFIHLLGVPDKWSIVDVYDLEPEALVWVPQPVIALILLFPCSDKFYDHAQKEAEQIKEKGQTLVNDLIYMKQYVSNACGSIALIHCVANNADRLDLQDGVFKKILEEAKNLTPEERGQMLSQSNSNSEAYKLITAHQELAMEGQTEVNPNEQVNHHFVALVRKGGYLYELDGRKEFPVNHGPTNEETFLQDAAKVCQEFIKRDSEDVNFTVMALVQHD
ncbi:ubiquitin carboxyl-terminal hydrolase [Euwallacea similis]|uniref:ubiquitin carboxyl-terminal hydrolase n=1 Tax=Euwallacea similis TaxID=1736056 RepID=UPI00344CEE81